MITCYDYMLYTCCMCYGIIPLWRFVKNIIHHDTNVNCLRMTLWYCLSVMHALVQIHAIYCLFGSKYLNLVDCIQPFWEVIDYKGLEIFQILACLPEAY